MRPSADMTNPSPPPAKHWPAAIPPLAFVALFCFATLPLMFISEGKIAAAGFRGGALAVLPTALATFGLFLRPSRPKQARVMLILSLVFALLAALSLVYWFESLNQAALRGADALSAETIREIAALGRPWAYLSALFVMTPPSLGALVIWGARRAGAEI